MLAELDALNARLTAERHEAASPGGAVHAEVDGHGELVAVRLAPGTLRTSRHPHLLGGEIVQAVAAARAAAAEHQQRLLAGLLPGGAPWTI